MNTTQLFVIALCGSLAACGGIHAQYSAAYDPNFAATCGPVAVSVVGPSDGAISQASVAGAATNALLALGVQARDVSMASGSDAMPAKIVVADASNMPGFSKPPRAGGLSAIDATSTAASDTEYRLTILYGPVAENLAKASDRDYGQSLCAKIDDQSTAAMAGSSSVTSVGGTPVLAVLCKQNTFQTMAYEKLDGPAEQILQAKMETLLTHVLPSRQMLGQDTGQGT